MVSTLQMKVCDICGDAGFLDCLAICSQCKEGAEHVLVLCFLSLQIAEDNVLNLLFVLAQVLYGIDPH